MQDKLHFKISAALKDIIGRDLITDDFVAIFELVKNSYDAYASRVDIYFENLNKENAKIIIKDNGKGMDYNDLINKWLFVAYSAKREGTEDNTFDYRNKISVQRAFAGAKGIGRFSCDRLGRILNMETTKLEDNPITQVLKTEWEKFEKDLQAEFIDISVLHAIKPKSDFGLEHGTVLEITDLRSDWDRNKLLKLKESLSKLINPNNQKEKEFSIHFHVPELEKSDEDFYEPYEKVNGEVENFIFDTLDLKTTKITATISNDGKYIETELIDGGTLIYRIKEKNKFHLLYGINYTLYYLNRSAKITFTKRMGLSVSQYGNIFLYKNGFRVYPFGEPGEDPLKINVRKSQGYSRFLGLRELIGQIEINNNDNELRETSSRGDGFIRTTTYFQFEDCFWETLKRLERYVVDIQQWGFSIEDEHAFIDKDKISILIASLTGSEELLDIQYPDNFLDILESSQSGSAEQVIKNLNKLAFETGNERLIEEAKKVSIKLNQILSAKIEAEREAEIERRLAFKFKKDLDEKESENLFLKSVKSQDFDEVISFIHHIGITASMIENRLKGIYEKIAYGIDIPKTELKSTVEGVSIDIRKILSITRFATKANFKLLTENTKVDVVEFVREYINNIYKSLKGEDIKIIVLVSPIKVIKEFKPIELTIIIDNLINNAIKAKANQLIIEFVLNNDKLEIIFKDNGIGIPEENMPKLFNMGFTTTTGSGLGLYHTKILIEKMGGRIFINNNRERGVEVSILL